MYCICIGDTDLPISAWQFLQGVLSSPDHSNALMYYIDYCPFLGLIEYILDENVLRVLQYGVENVSD